MFQVLSIFHLYIFSLTLTLTVVQLWYLGGTHVNFHLFPVSMFSPFHVFHLFFCESCANIFSLHAFPHFHIISTFPDLFPVLFPSFPISICSLQKHFTITLGIPITIIYHPNSCPKNQAVLPTGSHRYFH
jgi:hypothetical protein